MSSSPPMPSTPEHNNENSNDAHSTVRDTFSTSQRHDAVPSSPLFMPPSSDSVSGPSSQIRSSDGHNRSAHLRSALGGLSSPVAQPTSDLFSSSSTGLGSSQRQRLHSRGDIHSSDFLSSPMKRRFFTEGSGAGPSSSGLEGVLTSSSGLPSSASSSALPSSDAGNSNSLTSGANLPQSTATNTSTSHAPDEPVRVIWGTNVSIQECSDNFRTFLMSFKMKYRKKMDDTLEDPDEDEKLYYTDMLNMMKETNATNLNLDCRNLLAYSSTKKLYYQLINYPQEVVPIMDQTIKDCLDSLVLDNAPNNESNNERDSIVDQIESNIYKVRPYNLENNKGLRELNPGDIDKLVTVKGIVIRSTPIIPDMKVAFFKCNVCDHTVVVENDRGLIQEPTKCPRPICGVANSMQLIHNRSSFANKQVVKLQETPDLVPDGQTPHSVTLLSLIHI